MLARSCKVYGKCWCDLTMMIRAVGMPGHVAELTFEAPRLRKNNGNDAHRQPSCSDGSRIKRAL